MDSNSMHLSNSQQGSLVGYSNAVSEHGYYLSPVPASLIRRRVKRLSEMIEMSELHRLVRSHEIPQRFRRRAGFSGPNEHLVSRITSLDAIGADAQGSAVARKVTSLSPAQSSTKEQLLLPTASPAQDQSSTSSNAKKPESSIDKIAQVNLGEYHQQNGWSFGSGTVTILFLFACYLLYKLWRRNGKTRKCLDEWPTSLLTPAKRRRRKSHEDEQEVDMSVRGISSSRQSSNGDGSFRTKHDTLTSRHGHKISQNAQDPDSIERLDSLPAELTRTSANEIDSRGKKGSVVMIGRKIANNPMVYAARQATRPRVNLIGKKMRKFIDDEAEEVRQRLSKSQSCKKFGKVVHLRWLLDKLSLISVQERQTKTEYCDEKIDSPSTEKPVRLNTSAVDEHKSSEMQDQVIEVIVHAGNRVQGTKDGKVVDKDATESGDLSDGKAKSNDPCCIRPSSECPVPNLTACSCQLVSVDEQSRSRSHTGCTYSNADRLQHNYSLSRPCCSASPLAANQQRAAMQHHANIVTPCAQDQHNHHRHHHQQQQLYNFCDSRHPIEPVDRNSSQPRPFSNRARHHYENYYDDENEDVYKHLTASIALQLGGLNTCQQCRLGDKQVPLSVGCTSLPIKTEPEFSWPNMSSLARDGTQQHLAPNECFRSQAACRCCSASMQQEPQTSPLTSKLHADMSMMLDEQQRQVCASNVLQVPASSSSELHVSSPSLGEASGDSGANFSLSLAPTFECYTNEPQVNRSQPNEFLVRATTACRDPKCNLCPGGPQSTGATLIEGALPATNGCPVQASGQHRSTSILVHQPSTATPPPLFGASRKVLRRRSDECHWMLASGSKMNSHTEQQVSEQHKLEPTILATQSRTGFNSSGSSNSPSPNRSGATAHEIPHKAPQCAQVDNNERAPRHVRRQLGCGPTLRSRDEFTRFRHSMQAAAPRRMSVAGDQLRWRDRMASGSGCKRLAFNAPELADQQHLLEHRASIASDGTNLWQQTARNLQVPHEADQLTQRASKMASGSDWQALNFGERLNCAKFKARACDSVSMFGSSLRGSSYSSSAGSSSGIGFSGSQCTNTPTTSVFPYSSFMPAPGGNKSEMFLPSEQQMTANRQEANSLAFFNQNPTNQVSSSMHHSVEDRNSSINNSQLEKFDGLACTQQVPNLDSLPFFAQDMPSDLAERVLPTSWSKDPICQLPSEQVNNGISNIQATLLNHEQPYIRHRADQFIVQRNDLLHAKQAELCRAWNDAAHLDERQLSARKYSLPVQLETHSSSKRFADISPIQNGLVDSSLVERKLPLIDQGCSTSRRSSQTITRQSSFWLEEVSPEVSQSASLNASDTESKQEHEQTSKSPDLSRSNDERRGEKDSGQTSGCNKQLVDERPSKAARGQSESPSSSSSSNSSRPLKPGNKCQPRQRTALISSGSNSTSSPSPDFFAKPSARLLSLATKSGTISKRRVFSRLRANDRRSRQTTNRRPVAELGQQAASYLSSASLGGAKPQLALVPQHKSAPVPNAPPEVVPNERPHSNEPAARSSTELTSIEGQRSCEQEDEFATFEQVFLDQSPSRRPLASDQNSASLERQCRDLWKLRATLYSDTPMEDSWSNYHQRLNRRYDSGYKSIENQYSSSVEGSTATMAAAGPINEVAQEQQIGLNQSDSLADNREESSSMLVRPPSGCSGLVAPSMAELADTSKQVNPGMILNNEQETCRSTTPTCELDDEDRQSTPSSQR